MTLSAPTPPAPEIAYQWLRNEISELPWDQEAFLSENTIARASGISRTPVREAMLRLESNGLLRRVPHKGAYIPALTERDIQQIMEVREVIGAWATRKVTEHRLLSWEEMDAVLRKQADAASDPVAFIQYDIQFHRMIVHAAGNPTFEEVYESQRFRQERLGVQAVLSERDRCLSVLEEHRAIARAIAEGDPERAASAAVGHVHSTRDILRDRRSG
jgi:DNA-binding GntR family transcriptional regulator